MAEIAVINKDNQDYDIRDKKLADASTASTVASGDAITLKTTAGTYVEIDRNSFVSAIRDVLGASITSNTGGTSDVNTLPALTSSGALKSISTSDIASVLGVGNYATLSHQTEFLSYYGYDSTVDCNNLLCGTRVVYSSNPNTPVNNGTHGLLLALAGEGDYVLQIAAIYNGDIRVRAKITGTWYDWKTIYTH